MNFKKLLVSFYASALILSSLSFGQSNSTDFANYYKEKNKAGSFSKEVADISIIAGWINQRESKMNKGHSLIDAGINIDAQYINDGILFGFKVLMGTNDATIYQQGSLENNEVAARFNYIQGMLQTGYADLEVDADTGNVYGVVLACGIGYGQDTTNSRSDITGYQSPNSDSYKNHGFTYRLNGAYFFKNKAQFQASYAQVFNGIDSKYFDINGVQPIYRFKYAESDSAGVYATAGYGYANNQFNTRETKFAGVHYTDGVIKIGARVQLVNLKVGHSTSQKDQAKAVCPGFFFTWNLTNAGN
jgi:hypothetical protein